MARGGRYALLACACVAAAAAAPDEAPDAAAAKKRGAKKKAAKDWSKIDLDAIASEWEDGDEARGPRGKRADPKTAPRGSEAFRELPETRRTRLAAGGSGGRRRSAVTLRGDAADVRRLTFAATARRGRERG